MSNNSILSFNQKMTIGKAILNIAGDIARNKPDCDVFVSSIIRGCMTYAHINRSGNVYSEKNLRRKFKPKFALPTESFQIIEIPKKQPYTRL